MSLSKITWEIMFINDFTNSRCQMSFRCSMAGILSIWRSTPINQPIKQMGGKSCSIGNRDCNTLTLLYAKQRNPIDKIRSEKACHHKGVKSICLGFFLGGGGYGRIDHGMVYLPVGKVLTQVHIYGEKVCIPQNSLLRRREF